jgi:hypothetical protein
MRGVFDPCCLAILDQNGKPAVTFPELGAECHFRCDRSPLPARSADRQPRAAHRHRPS